MSRLDKVLDAKGQLLEVGMRIQVPGNWVDGRDAYWKGTIQNITDADGDLDGYGRPVAINPFIEVLFDDGDVDTFSTSPTAKGPWDDMSKYMCEDLEKC